MKPLHTLKNLLIAVACGVWLAGCGQPPLSSYTNIKAKYPDAEITMVDQFAQFWCDNSQWLVKTEKGVVVVWCADSGKIIHEQEITSSR